MKKSCICYLLFPVFTIIFISNCFPLVIKTHSQDLNSSDELKKHRLITKRYYIFYIFGLYKDRTKYGVIDLCDPDEEKKSEDFVGNIFMNMNELLDSKKKQKIGNIPNDLIITKINYSTPILGGIVFFLSYGMILPQEYKFECFSEEENFYD